MFRMETRWTDRGPATHSNHEWAGCAEGIKCTGPGCRLDSGKTQQDRQKPEKRKRTNDAQRRAVARQMARMAKAG